MGRVNNEITGAYKELMRIIVSDYINHIDHYWEYRAMNTRLISTNDQNAREKILGCIFSSVMYVDEYDKGKYWKEIEQEVNIRRLDIKKEK